MRVPATRGSPRIVAVEGIAGVGKTTASRALARALRAVWLKEATARIRPPPDLRVTEPSGLLTLERRLVAEEVRRYRTAVADRRRGRSTVADTGFLGPFTYATAWATIDPRMDARPALRRLAAVRLRTQGVGVADLHLVLTLPVTSRRRRRRGDPRRDPDLDDRHDRIGRVEMRLWRRLARGPLRGRVRFVSAAGRPGSVASRIISVVHAHPLREAPPFRVSDLVAALFEKPAGPRPGRRGRRAMSRPAKP